MAQPAPLQVVSGGLAALRWAFMPVGLLALVAVGVHQAADLVDDRLLRGVEATDAWLDGVLAASEATAAWVDRFGSPERTLVARALALAWELAVDVAVALPLLGYAEADRGRFSFRRDTWRTLLARLNRHPTSMRLLRPVATAAFVGGGAWAISRLVEATLFSGLVGDVASPSVAAVLARVGGGVALLLVLGSHGWRAVLRALEHADARCAAVEARGGTAFAVGVWGSALAVPLALSLVLETGALLSFFR